MKVELPPGLGKPKSVSDWNAAVSSAIVPPGVHFGAYREALFGELDGGLADVFPV